jgi:hypothetical protein
LREREREQWASFAAPSPPFNAVSPSFSYAKARVLLNGKEVSRLALISLTASFEAQLQQRVRCRLSRWPKELIVQLWQYAGILSRPSLLSEVFLPLPSPSQVVSQAATSEVEFSSLAHARVSAPSAGAPDQDDSLPVEYLTGALAVAVGWAAHPSDGRALCPPAPQPSQEAQLRTVRRLQALAALGCAGLPDHQHQQQWLTEAGFDPNDPDNAPLVATVAALGGGTVTQRSLNMSASASFVRGLPAMLGGGIDTLREGADPPFRLYDAQTGEAAMPLTSPEEDAQLEMFDAGSFVIPGEHRQTFRLTPRQRLMRLRHEQEPLVRSARVPLLEDEVPAGLLHRAIRHRRRGSGDGDDEGPHDLDEADPVLLRLLRQRRSGVGAFLHGVREEQAARLKALASQRRLSEVVNEEALPNIKGLGQVLARAVEPRRPLRPLRNPRRKAAPFVAARVQVVVRVGQAMNVPLRGDGTELSTGVAGNDGALERRLSRFMSSLVAPVVEVELQGQRVQTAAARGTSAVYNEEFVLSFRPPNGDASPESIRHCQDVISFHLLDCFEVSNRDGGGGGRICECR